MSARFEELVGNAILGIDTLWGGDVMCASGTGRFIADSWFSDEPLPLAYTVAEAARVRAIGRRFRQVARRGGRLIAYLAQVDIPGAIEGLKRAGARVRRPARRVSGGPGAVFRDHVGPGHGDPRPRRAGPVRTLRAGLHRPAPGAVRSGSRSASAWRNCSAASADLLAAVDAWRARHRVSMASIRLLGAAVIGHFDQLDRRSVSSRTCRTNSLWCRAPISSSCRSKMPGSPAR